MGRRVGVEGGGKETREGDNEGQQVCTKRGQRRTAKMLGGEGVAEDRSRRWKPRTGGR